MKRVAGSRDDGAADNFEMITLSGDSKELLNNPQVKKAYLGI